MMTHLTDDDLVLHYYGEMDPGDESRTGTHLAECAACQQNYVRLQRVMAYVDCAPAVDAPAGFERVAWARVEAALPSRRGGWLTSALFSPGRLALAAALVLVVTGAFLAGRLGSRNTPATVAAPAAASAAQVRERILLVDLGDHLDRSQMMLIELVSAESNAGGNVDISTEQARAQQLVAANRLYRQSAATTGDTAMASLLDELERTLIDIAASPSTLTQADLDQVRQRIESKGLLFKVRVVSSEVRDRQRAEIRERTGQRALATTKS